MMPFTSRHLLGLSGFLLLSTACPPAPSGEDAGVRLPDTRLEPAPAAFTRETSLELSFVAEPTEGAGFECSLDEAPFTTCTSPHVVSGLSEGAHHFAVRARLGEEADPSPATHAFTVDLTPPETTLANRPAELSRSASATFAFSSSEEGRDFLCSLDGEEAEPCTSPRSISGLSDGAHSFSVAAVDRAGNVDPTAELFPWFIDTVKPETVLTRVPPESEASPSATFEFTADEAEVTFECAVDGAAFSPCASPFTTRLLASGPHTFTVRAKDRVGNLDESPAEAAWSITPGTLTLRAMAANVSSGTHQSYDPGEGIRIFQALSPDVVLIQEFKFGTNSEMDLREFVDTAFGPEFVWAREPATLGSAIPNGIISRFPILDSGVWDDPLVSNREFVWARIDVPGTRDLWAVSVHFLTSNASERAEEAGEVVEQVQQHVPAGDFLLVGGDFNTRSRTESAIATLGAIVVTSGPHPVDQNGNGFTSANRSEPYDWLLADTDLHPLRTTVVIGSSSYANGLVFDSRVYTPLTEVTPVLEGDSGAEGMQHMPVVRDFAISY